jgi:hypothetical protein
MQSSNANFKLNQSVFAINESPLYFEISEDDHAPTHGHPRIADEFLNFANSLLSPGVNSRAELVPSHGAPRRWLGD